MSKNLLIIIVAGVFGFINANAAATDSSNNNTTIDITAHQQSKDAVAFSPFYDFTIDYNPQPDTLVNLANASGIKHITLAFVAANNGSTNSCDAAWGGYNEYRVADSWGETAIQNFGSDKVTISFGGAFGPYLFDKCYTTSDLYTQYQNVINTYNVTDLDFDIENWSAPNEEAARTRMIQALKMIQTNNPQVKISFTLPASPEIGLPLATFQFLQQAVSDGLNIDEVNIMAMDYYWIPPDYEGKSMWDVTLGTVIPYVMNQLQNLFPNKTTEQLAQMLRITPLIGQNDAPQEIFTKNDMAQLVNYAKEHGNPIAFWSLNRDHPCASDHPPIGQNTFEANDCSGSFDVDGNFTGTNYQTSHYEFAKLAE